MPSSTPAVTAARHRRRGGVLLAIATWQVWLWGTRAWNMVQDSGDFSVAFVTVHLVLFAGSFGMAAYLATIGWRMRREADAGTADTDPSDLVDDHAGVPA